jgi:phosphatidylglycerophosphate synthase
MLDAHLRRLIDPPLNRAGRLVAERGISANAITLGGFAVGLAAVPAIAVDLPLLGLALILLNRLADGLDGAVARHAGPSDLGGYLDIVCDFLFYAAVVFAFALRDPAHAPAAAFLIFSFVGTGSSFLAYAVMAAKRGLTTEIQGNKSLYYLGGLTEGSETIAVFVLLCLWPAAFVEIAVVFGALCWLTTLTRVIAAWQSFKG